jgi:hypothetical protein
VIALSLVLAGASIVFSPLFAALAATATFNLRFTTNDTGDIVFVANTVTDQPRNGTRVRSGAGWKRGKDRLSQQQLLFDGVRQDRHRHAWPYQLEQCGPRSTGALTAAPVPGSASTPEAYQMFSDVTSLVQAGGAGTYTVANVQTDLGTDRYGAWGLVVVVRDPSQPPAT